MEQTLLEKGYTPSKGRPTPKDPTPRNFIRKMMGKTHNERNLKTLRMRSTQRSLCIKRQRISLLQKIVQTGKTLFNTTNLND